MTTPPKFPTAQVWPAIVGPEHGPRLQLCLGVLAMIPADVLREATAAIDRETTLGPLLDPSQYTDGRRFDNAAEYRQLLRDLLPVVEQLNKLRARKAG